MIKRLFAAKSIEPSYPTLPIVDAEGQTSIPGIYAVGEIAGAPLIRLGLNAGHELIQTIGPKLLQQPASREPKEGGIYDLVIVGSGSAGFAATVAARDMGLSYVTLEAEAFANTFATMTKGKWLFAEPHNVVVKSRVWFEECTKEALLERWRTIRSDEKLNIHEYEPVLDIRGSAGNFTVKTKVAEYATRAVALCIGKAGNSRKLDVPGEREQATKIFHRLNDPDDFVGKSLVIVGAGDVACEAAVALAQSGTNRVMMTAVDKEFTYPKKRNIDAVRQLEREGKLHIALDSAVTRFNEDTVVIEHRRDHRTESVPYDAVFEMIGAVLPIGFLRKVGIRLNTDWSLKKWIVLGTIFVGVYSLYALKSYGKGLVAWPYEFWIDAHTYDATLNRLFDVCFAPFSGLFSSDALDDLQLDRGFQQGYLYSLLYTLVMIVFGYFALMRWRAKAKQPQYQTYRYISLLAFQLGFFLIVNVVGVHALSVKYAWRAWGLYQPFPLFFNTFFWWYPEDPFWLKFFFVVGGLIGTVGLIPWLSRNHGKRFCTWICGCGGLAETLGDRWRHLSPKGVRSRAWEFQATVVMVAAFLVGIVVVGMYRTDGNNLWWKTYSYLVDFWLVAVIPIALYPFFGGKIWCRYWCPLAAYNQWLAKWYGRLKIVSNDKCITCTECSKYCQVGVDVMAFAKNQQPFDNSNSSCIHCGICIDVCPVSVLSFETSSPNALQLIAQKKSSGTR